MIRHTILMLALVAAAATPILAQDGPVPDPDGERAIAIAHEIEAKVESIRGLRFKKPVKIGAYRRDALVDVVREMTSEELGSDEAKREFAALTMMGFLPRDYDVAESALAFLESQIAGFYEPERKELFLVIENDESNAEMMAMMGMTPEVTMFHELVHALQDQHFDLTKFIEGAENQDVAQARRTLVEGDATFNMIRLDDNPMLTLNYAMMPSSKVRTLALLEMAKSMGGPGSELEQPGADVLAATPSILVDPMLFNYADGYRFVKQLVGDKKSDGSYDMSRLDAAFASPPLSTEQILYPEKFLDESQLDYPTRVELPDLSERLGLELRHGDTLGELLLRTLLIDKDMKRISRTHRGWDGDRFEYYADEQGREALVWASIWDSHSDAEQFADALLELLAERHPDAQFEPHPSTGVVRGLDGEIGMAIMRGGNKVWLVEGVAQDRLDGTLIRAVVGTRFHDMTP